jgi:hypothetical protein
MQRWGLTTARPNFHVMAATAGKIAERNIKISHTFRRKIMFVNKINFHKKYSQFLRS